MIASSLVIKNALCFEPFDRFFQYLPLEKQTALRITPVHLINPIICPLAMLQAHLQIVMADQVKGGSIFTIFKNQTFLWLLNWVKTVKPCGDGTAAQVFTFIPRTPQYNAGFSSAVYRKPSVLEHTVASHALLPPLLWRAFPSSSALPPSRSQG